MVYHDRIAEPLEAQVGKIINDMFVLANKLQAMKELEEGKERRKDKERERQFVLLIIVASNGVAKNFVERHLTRYTVQEVLNESFREGVACSKCGAFYPSL